MQFPREERAGEEDGGGQVTAGEDAAAEEEEEEGGNGDRRLPWTSEQQQSIPPPFTELGSPEEEEKELRESGERRVIGDSGTAASVRFPPPPFRPGQPPPPPSAQTSFVAATEEGGGGSPHRSSSLEGGGDGDGGECLRVSLAPATVGGGGRRAASAIPPSEEQTIITTEQPRRSATFPPPATTAISQTIAKESAESEVSSSPTKKVDTLVVLQSYQEQQQQKQGLVRRLLFHPAPHVVALLYTCPVFTLNAIGSMISASCKSQAEVFAHTLQSKLHFLNSPGGGEQKQEDGGLTSAMKHNGGGSFPYPGTTFPPGGAAARCFAEHMRATANFYSEPDLTPAAAVGGGGNGCGGGGKHHGETSVGGVIPGTAKFKVSSDEDDGNDSDLFFDFDIGSPDEEDEDERHQHGSNSRVSPPRRKASSEMEEEEEECDCDKSSVAFGSTSSGLCSDAASAHGGMMGGEGGDDMQSSELENVLDDAFIAGSDAGIALDPQAWLAKRSLQLDLGSPSGGNNSSNTSSSTPIATQSPSGGGCISDGVAGSSSSSPLISPDSLLDEPVGSAEAPKEMRSPDSEESIGQRVPVEQSLSHDERGEGGNDNKEVKEATAAAINDAQDKFDSSLNKSAAAAETSSEADSFSVYTGEQKHKVAHSKLNALIALLEKDREYAGRPSPPKESEESGSPTRGGAPGSPTKKSYKCSLPTIAASPANFSFLTAAKGNSSSNTNTNSNSNKVCGSYSSTSSAGRSAASPMKRCDSTPSLTSAERELIQSPQLQRRRKVAVPAEEGKKAVAEQSSASAQGKEQKKEEGLEMPEQPQKLRRASSLKSGKTPPGTPSRRKIVRFADVFGLDLADVKTFFDEIPRIPKSAYSDLKDAELSDLDSDLGSEAAFPSYGGGGNGRSDPFRNFLSARGSSPSPMASSTAAPSATLVPMFSQPGGFPNFFDLIRDKRVCLENAYMSDPGSVKGTVRVQNVGFHKRVSLLYTTNEWLTQSEVDAEYMQGSCDGFSDKFTFHLRPQSGLSVGQRLQFCLRYEVNGEKFWDNNGSRNYVFQCLGGRGGSPTKSPSSSPSPAPSPALPRPVPAQSHHHGYGMSHSPSAMSEDPWLRYL